MKVKIKKLVENAVIPTYAKPGDAGLDLTATGIEIKGDNITYGCGLAKLRYQMVMLVCSFHAVVIQRKICC